MVRLADQPNMRAVILTVGHTAELMEDGTTGQWAALTKALSSEHTPEQLADMFVGACTLLVLAGHK